MDADTRRREAGISSLRVSTTLLNVHAEPAKLSAVSRLWDDTFPKFICTACRHSYQPPEVFYKTIFSEV